jgi:mRNA-degrading endonuclease RelE of RelBE toxin-antitoxin system
MSYSVLFTPRAANELRALRAADRAKIAELSQRILSVSPTLVSKARVKRLSGGVFPPYRLRVDDFRVFYDVEEGTQRVMIYGVVSKSQANDWLAAFQKERSHEDDDT